jgi:hypothetical protein
MTCRCRYRPCRCARRRRSQARLPFRTASPRDRLTASSRSQFQRVAGHAASPRRRRIEPQLVALVAQIRGQIELADARFDERVCERFVDVNDPAHRCRSSTTDRGRRGAAPPYAKLRPVDTVHSGMRYSVAMRRTAWISSIGAGSSAADGVNTGLNADGPTSNGSRSRSARLPTTPHAPRRRSPFVQRAHARTSLRKRPAAIRPP